jgi:hypothetical protein
LYLLLPVTSTTFLTTTTTRFAIAIAIAIAIANCWSSMNELFGPSFGDDPAIRSSSPLSPLSEVEAKFYYAGLLSAPVLVARTSTTPWEVPNGPDAYCKHKELRVVSYHALTELWEDNLALKR